MTSKKTGYEYFGTFPVPKGNKKAKLNNDVEVALESTSFLETVKLINRVNELFQDEIIYEILSRAFPEIEIKGRDFTEIMQLISILVENLSQ